MIRNYTLPDFLDEVTREIQDRIRQPIKVSGQNLNVSASMGICHFPGDCAEPEELLRGAEAARKRWCAGNTRSVAGYRPSISWT